MHISDELTLGGLKHLLNRTIDFKTAVAIAAFWLACFLAAKAATGYFSHEVDVALDRPLPAGVDLREGDFWASESLTKDDAVKWTINHRQPDSRAFRLDNFMGYTRHITFDPPFSENPRVLVVLSDLEIPPGENIRLLTSVGSIGKAGCDIKIETWNVSTIDVVSVHWLAYQPAPSDESKAANSSR